MPTTTVTHFTRKPLASYYSIESVYEDVRKHLPDDIDVKVVFCRHETQGVFRRLRDIWHVAWHQSDVNHVTGDVHYLTFLMRRRRTILTIHDCVALDHARGWRWFVLWLVWYWLPMHRCFAVVTVSEATKQRLLQVVTYPSDRIHVIRNPLGPEFRPVPQEFNEARPRVLLVGTRPNKNLDRIAAALSGIACDVLVLGRVTEAQAAEFDRQGVAFRSIVDLPRSEVVNTYAACDLLVFASTYEGFGLPIIEAQAVGRPVVTSDLLSMPEVAGGAACLVNPFDVKSIRDGILRVMRDRAYREELVRRGHENVARFDAAAVAGEYARLYRAVAAGASA